MNGDRSTGGTGAEGRAAQATSAAQADLMYAKRLIAGGDVRRAIKLLADSVQTTPSVEALILLARLELDVPTLNSRALEHLRHASELEPRCTEAWLMLANHWGMRGHPDKQRRCLEKILGYDPGNRDARDAIELIGPSR